MRSLLKTSFFLLLTMIIFSACKKKNNPPQISAQEFTVAENSAQGTFIGKISAIDADNDTALTYSIVSGNTNDAVQISASGGNITVNNENALDFETNSKIILTVSVTDSHNASSTGTITINLTDKIAPVDGLLIYYPFNGNVSDSSGNGYNCINYTSGNYVAGRWGQGLDFNGTSDYLRLPFPLNSAFGLTFSFWFLSRGAIVTENNGAIISKYNMHNDSRCFMVYSFCANATRNDNRLSAAFYTDPYSSAYHDMTKSYLETAELSVYPTDPSYWSIIHPERIEVGKWTHAVVNMTQTSLEIWLDGVLCTKKTREYASYYNSQFEPVYIGNNVAIGDGSNNHFNGILDEFRVYSRALTPDEIKTLFKER